MNKIYRRCLSDPIATMKAQWALNMEMIDRLYYERERLELAKSKEGLNMIIANILRLSSEQIALDKKIQQYYKAKNEFLYHKFRYNGY